MTEHSIGPLQRLWSWISFEDAMSSKQALWSTLDMMSNQQARELDDDQACCITHGSTTPQLLDEGGAPTSISSEPSLRGGFGSSSVLESEIVQG